MATGVLVLGVEPRHPAARPPDAHRQGVRRHGAARRRHHDRRRRGRGGRRPPRPRRSPRTTCARALAEFVGDLLAGPHRGLRDQGRRQARLPAGPRRRGGRARSRDRSRCTSSSCTRCGSSGDVVDVDLSLRCSSGTYVRAIARDARRPARGRRPPDRAAAYRRRALRPRRRPHPRRARRPVRGAADRRRRPRGVPVASTSTTRPPATSGSVARSTLELAGLSAVFAPDGEFLALYEPRDGRARPVAVFV